jgi:hypothetical protein
VGGALNARSRAEGEEVKNHVERMMDSLVYDGSNRIKDAWLSFLATYTYTRAHDGLVINDEGETISFGRWYSFCAAVQVAWGRLWQKERK